MPEHKPLSGSDALLLIASCALTILPFFFFQPASFSILAVVLLAWRAYLSYSRLLSPPKGLIVFIGLLSAALALFEFHTLLGREAGLAFLSLLLPLKLLEARSTRDARVATSLCCFLLTGQFLLAQTLPMAALVLACALCILATTASIQQPGQGLRRNFGRAARLLLAGLPIMLLFFLLFPRLDGPLWRLPMNTKAARTGLSDTMSPGSISALIKSGEIAFWVDFHGQRPPAHARYWRALVLSDFDGQAWRVGLQRPATAPSPSTPIYSYDLTLEAHDRVWMPVLDYLVGSPTEGRYLEDFSLRSANPVSARKRYALLASPGARLGLAENGFILRANRFLPPGFNPRTLALGHAIAANTKDPARRIEQGLRAMREAKLAYTLEPPLLGRNSADEFLFYTRRGFCEHFSSSFVILMRAAGLPARVVTGYLGGEINPVDGTLVVRQSDAHAWAEVWLSDRGWVRVDPTAESEPRRLDQGIALALPEADLLPLSLRANHPWLRSLRHRWEALNHGWNEWVLGYDAKRQFEFLRTLGFPGADWPRLIALLAAGAAIWMGWLSLAAWPRRPRADALDETWRKFCARLAHAGLAREPWEAPSAFAQRASLALPAQAQEIRQIAEEYAMLRYGPLAPRAPDIARFKQRASYFKPRQER